MSDTEALVARIMRGGNLVATEAIDALREQALEIAKFKEQLALVPKSRRQLIDDVIAMKQQVQHFLKERAKDEVRATESGTVGSADPQGLQDGLL